jgi:formate hydrogenlyase subunit 3/multisubunit Na+/H+ antiporter MnhD subunit
MACLVAAPLASAVLARLGSAFAITGCVLLVIVGIDAASGGARPVLDLGTWLGFGTSHLRADGTAGIFLTLTGLAGGATAIAYIEGGADRRLTILGSAVLLFIALVVGAGNGFLFFGAWEALSVCIYLIASGDRDNPASLSGGYFTGALSKLGGAALLAAVGLLYGHTHTFELAAWSHAHLSAGTRGVVFVLLLTAFGTKIGLLPVQGGLPAGYASAPRLGAASLSVALSAGFYGLWRFEVDVLAPLPTWCGDTLLVLGALTAVVGIVYAVTQDDLRRFLGYSTVEHAGIVLLGLGVALLGQAAHNRMLAAAGLLAASLHVCAHNLAKTLALIAVARVEQTTKQRSLNPLGGLGRRMPPSAAGLGVASMTLAAIPPLGGFVSEWFTLEALLQGFRMPTLLSQLLCALAAAALSLTAGVGLLAFAKYFSFIFLGPERRRVLGSRLPGWRRQPSLWPLTLLLLFLGTIAPWEIRWLGDALRPVLGINPATTAITSPLVLGPVFQNFSVLAPTWLTIVLPGFAVIAFLITRASGPRRTRRAPVWVTGSSADVARVQYQPSAYSNPLRYILRGPLGYRARIEHGTGSDEDKLVYETSVVNVFDQYLYRPVSTIALAASDRVRRLQSGRLSTYLLYMLVALIAALALIPILH